MRIRFLIILIVLLTILLSACGNTTAPAAEPTLPGTLTFTAP